MGQFVLFLGPRGPLVLPCAARISRPPSFLFSFFFYFFSSFYPVTPGHPRQPAPPPPLPQLLLLLLSGGSGLLQLIIRKIWPLADDHPSPTSPLQWSRFNLAVLSRTICSCLSCIVKKIRTENCNCSPWPMSPLQHWKGWIREGEMDILSASRENDENAIVK